MFFVCFFSLLSSVSSVVVPSSREEQAPEGKQRARMFHQWERTTAAHKQTEGQETKTKEEGDTRQRAAPSRGEGFF